MTDLGKKILGAWQLTSFEVTKPGREPAPWGKDSHGILIYTPDGHVSLSVNRLFASTPDDFKGIYDSILFYAGRFEIKDAPRLVHYLTEASNPEKIGRVMERDVWVEGDQLIMNGWGAYGTSKFLWKKL